MSEVSIEQKRSIPYGRQMIEEDDIAAVVDVLRSPYLTTGPKISEFEQAFAAKIGSKYAVTYSSGTAALHGMMFAAGIGKGDEVLVPTMSFAASANAACFTGATPVFVDVEPGGLNLDLADAAKKITAKTKAIMPVHFAGEPVDIDAVQALAKKHNLLVLEDAAHALGATYKKKFVGALSDMVEFSFHPVKHITTGEGGMVTTNNPEFYARLKMFRHHGIDVDAATREKKNQWFYDMQELGYNYRMTDMQAALGISQLKKIDRFVKRRREIATLYKELLKNETGIALPRMDPNFGEHAWHLYVITLDSTFKDGSRDELFTLLRGKGVGAHVHYRPIHLHSYHQRTAVQAAACPRVEDVWKRILTLPIFPGMSDDDVRYVVANLIQGLRQIKGDSK